MVGRRRGRAEARDVGPAGTDEVAAACAWALEAAAAHGLPSASLRRHVGQIQARRRDPVLRVAVVGEFNAGKSTFINALCRAEVLPTSALVSTAAVTTIVHGEEQVRLRLRGDRRELVLPRDAGAVAGVLRTHGVSFDPEATLEDQLRSVIADDLAASVVQSLVICRPGGLLGEGIEVLDTPGLNSTHAGHSDATQSAVARVADLVLVLVPATQPVTAVIEQFVETDLALHRRTAFCLTKADLLRPDELADVLPDATATIRRLTEDPDAVVVPVSAGPALQAYAAGRDDEATRAFERVEQELVGHLRRSREAAIAQAARRLTDGLLVDLDGALRARSAEAVDRAERLEAVPVRDVDRWLHAWAAEAKRALDARWAARAAETASATKTELAAWERTLHTLLIEPASLSVTATNLRQRVPTTLEAVRGIVATTLRQRFADPLGDAFAEQTERLAGSAADQVGRLAALAGAHPKLPAPRPPALDLQPSIDLDLRGALTAIQVAQGRSRGRTGRGAGVGAVIGTVLAPGVGTAIGAALGGAFNAPSAQEVKQEQQRVYGAVADPVRQGALEEVRRLTEAGRAAVLAAVDAHASAFRAAWSPTIDRLVAAEAAQRAELADTIRGLEAARRTTEQVRRRLGASAERREDRS